MVGQVLLTSSWVTLLSLVSLLHPSFIYLICLAPEGIRVCHLKCDPWKLFFVSRSSIPLVLAILPSNPALPALGSNIKPQPCILPSIRAASPSMPSPPSLPGKCSFVHLSSEHVLNILFHGCGTDLNDESARVAKTGYLLRRYPQPPWEHEHI